MEHPALIEEVAVFGPEALGSADRLRIAANTLGVMDRVPVACFDGTSKGEQHSLRRIERLDAIFCLAHVVAEIREATLEKLAVRLLVVNDQHFRPARVDELFCHRLVKARWPSEWSARAAARHRAGPARRSALRGTRQSPRTSRVRS